VTDDLDQLIVRLNDDPDPAHGDLTPAVHQLIARGMSALPAVMPSLDSEDPWTRLRAQRVFEAVTRTWVRERTPARPITPRADHEWLALWQANGNFQWDAPAAARTASLRQWREWLSRQIPGAG
jgi:hypothetical protein